MNAATDNAIRGSLAIVEDYFTEPVRALLDWTEPLSEKVADARSNGLLTRSKLDDLVKPHALATLALRGAPVYGAGFIAAIDLLPDARSHLAWWQGAEHRQLVLASQSLNKENIDYTALEWFRVPMSTGSPHVAGPYVDYLCSDEYTITIAVPVEVDGVRIGVAGLDLLVGSVERDLTARFTEFGRQITVTNRLGRVVVSTDPAWATGDAVRGSGLSRLSRVSCEGLPLDIIVEGP